MTTRKTTTPDRPAPWPSGLVIVDKPGGMTSHDVVGRLRRLARTRRVGHAGTLDPMATGVLVIGIEKATRLLGHLMLTEKTYAATIRLGRSTTTDDAEGEPTGGSPASGVTRDALDTEIAKLTGDILQVPSSVSAIKVNGQRAYKLTRAGEAPVLAARPVTVYEFAVGAVRADGDFLDVDAVVRCSSGTYIRALARDLGTALGTGGHLTALRRTAVGPYTLAQASTLEQLQDQEQNAQAQPQPQAERTRVQPVTPPPAPSTAPASPPAPATPAPHLTQTAPAAPATHLAQTAPASPDSPLAQTAPAPPASPVPPLAQTAPAPPATPDTPTPPVPACLIPLAEAAAAAFPRLDLTAADALRLAQGAKLPLPSAPPSWPAPAGSTMAGPSWPARDAPIAAFAPDGTLVALVTADQARLKSLAVFVDAQARA